MMSRNLGDPCRVRLRPFPVGIIESCDSPEIMSASFVSVSPVGCSRFNTRIENWQWVCIVHGRMRDAHSICSIDLTCSHKCGGGRLLQGSSNPYLILILPGAVGSAARHHRAERSNRRTKLLELKVFGNTEDGNNRVDTCVVVLFHHIPLGG